MAGSDGLRVLVAGGGVAGIETLLAVQALAGDRVVVEMLAPDRHFSHRPLSVTEPFTVDRPQRIRLAAIAADRNVVLHRDAVARVDPDRRVVETQDHARLEYDVLVLALGARALEAVRGAETFRGSQDADRVRVIVAALREGLIRRVVFVAPAGVSWSLPIYELALQTAHVVPNADLHLVTAEPTPLAAFGSAMGSEIAALITERGISLHADTTAEEFADGRLWLAGAGAPLTADRVIALPRLVGPHVSGAPSDPLGFVPVDEFTRALGADVIHAVGDVAAHGLKQGGLAAQQADVAAQVIAATAGADVTPAPYRPVLRGMLLCGDQVRYLRHVPGGESEVSDEMLWWPPHKVAGSHLANYLAGHAELAVNAGRSGPSRASAPSASRSS